MRRLALLAALLLLCGCVTAEPTPPPSIESTEPPPSETDSGDEAYADKVRTLNSCDFFEIEQFMTNVEKSAEYGDFDGVFAATVPHHAPFMYMACSVLESTLAGGAPATIVVVGPDHEGIGNGITLALNGWNTPFGELSADGAAFERILNDTRVGAVVGDALLSGDHSVSVIMPYVKYYMPDVNVVSILVSKYTERERLDALAEVISKLDDVFLMASIDFSHYQTPEACSANDRASMSAILDDDTAALLNMDGAYLDSPEAMYLVMELTALKKGEVSLTDGETSHYVEGDEPRAASYYVYTAR